MKKTPDYVQLNYRRTLEDGLPGSNADLNPTYDNCFVAGEDIEYGTVISCASKDVKPVVAKKGKNNVVATGGFGIGGSPLAPLAELKAFKEASFKILVDGTEFAVSAVNLSEATNYEDVATAIQTQLQAATLGGETVAAEVVDGATFLKIKSAKTGSASTAGPMLPDSADSKIVEKLGWTTYYNEAGIDGVTAAVLGVVIRNVVDTSTEENSGIPLIREGSVGAYRQDGTIKVMAQEAVADGSDVYYSHADGTLFGTTSGGRSKLGSSKWIGSVSAGQVGIIDIRGLR